MLIRRRISSGTKIEIGGKFGIHPGNDSLAEAADHNADGRHHRDSRAECGNENGSAAKGTGKTARSEESFKADEFLQRMRDHAHREVNKSRDRKNARGHGQQSRDVTEDGFATHGRNARSGCSDKSKC